MHDFSRRLALLLAVALLPATIGKAAAQQSTTATYNDWVLQCQSEAGPPPKKTCDIAQVTQVQGRNIPFSRVGVLRPEKGQPVKLVVQVPVNVSLSANVHIELAGNDPGWMTPFNRCLPTGCFAEFELKDDAIRKIRSATQPGKITFKAANGEDVAVPVSFKGFGPAFDALIKE